jgi:hypothetical protein
MLHHWQRSQQPRLIAYKSMSPDEINAGCSELFDAWCERRAVRPLRHLLSAWPLTSGLTDDWGALREALRALRADRRTEIPDTELGQVDDLIRAVDLVVFRQ